MKNIQLLMVIVLSMVTTLVSAKSLTEEDVSAFVAATPKLEAVLKEITPPMTKKQGKKFMRAQMDGVPYTTMAKMLGTEYIGQLDKAAKANGYKDYNNYAQIGDRFFSVVFSARWVKGFAGFLEEYKDKQQANLFQVVKDKSLPENERVKLKGQFDSFCKKVCVNTNDVAIVEKHYDTLAKVLHLK